MPPILDIPGRAALTAGKLICVGRNYAAHAAEMGNDVPESPMIFLKPASAITPDGSDIVIPERSSDVHHEIELVAAIGLGGKDIREANARDHVAGYAVGLDMTARDIQASAKKEGHPWTVAKGFDTFAPLGMFVPARAVLDPQSLKLRLEVNGEVRQEGRTSDMLFPVAQLVAFCSSIMTLEPGDLIYTGTPEGVGPVVPGDILEASITGLPTLKVGVR